MLFDQDKLDSKECFGKLSIGLKLPSSQSDCGVLSRSYCPWEKGNTHREVKARERDGGKDT